MIIGTILELVESLFACVSQQKWNANKEIRRSNCVCRARRLHPARSCLVALTDGGASIFLTQETFPGVCPPPP